MNMRWWGMLGLVALLSACGGGGDGCSSSLGSLVGSSALCREDANKAPVADAGADQNVRVGAVVTVDGAFSRDPDGQALRYQWQWVTKPASSGTALASGDAPRAAFVADVPGTYVLSLVVSDGKASSVPANVTITATALNVVPVASAGAAQVVVVGQPVTLDGTASTDADRQPLGFDWQLITRPAGSSAVLRDASSARPGLTPDVPGLYGISLVVNDGSSSSAPALVTVTAGLANVAPVANAGQGRDVMAGDLVTLDGSASSDANRDALSYEWTLLGKPAGSSASLSSPSEVRPQMRADVPGTYVLGLTVSDGQLRSEMSIVTVVATAVNSAPQASAGPDKSVLVGSVVTLDGSGSRDANGDELQFAWSVVARPEGSAASLSSGSVARPTFTPDQPGIYAFSLKVSDGMTDSAPSVVVVTAGRINAAPVANAGVFQNVVVGTQVRLDGSLSSDNNGDALTFAWQLVTRPLGSSASLSSSSAVLPTFTADRPGTYVFSLVVRDGSVNSEPSIVAVTAFAANVEPVARAGTDQNVLVGALVRLDGSASSDDNRDPLTFAWSLLARPASSSASLSSATAARPTFTPDVAGTYVFGLVVSDGQLGSQMANVVVHAASMNAAPVAMAGPDQTVLVGSVVTLDGSASSDANRDALSFNWRLVSVPAGSAATLGGGQTVRPTLTADLAGTYVLSLSVSDGVLVSESDVVVITATTANIPPVAAPSRVGSGVVLVGSTVTFSGAGSSDAEGATLSYRWTLSARPADSSATLTTPDSLQTTLVTDVSGSYVVTLIVHDGQTSSAPVSVVIEAVP